jgi:hypothetical protein
MPCQPLPLTVSSKRNPPLKWNLSMTGNLRCFKLYRTHVILKMGNRVRYLKPRQSHGTTSNFQRNLHPAAIPFIIISLPFQTPSTVCRSPSQEPRYRKKVLLSKALPFPMCNKENRGIFHKWNIIAAVVLLI